MSQIFFYTFKKIACPGGELRLGGGHLRSRVTELEMTVRLDIIMFTCYRDSIFSEVNSDRQYVQLEHDHMSR